MFEDLIDSKRLVMAELARDHGGAEQLNKFYIEDWAPRGEDLDD